MGTLKMDTLSLGTSAFFCQSEKFPCEGTWYCEGDISCKMVEGGDNN